MNYRTPRKVLASVLGRTPTAINKAIMRLSIKREARSVALKHQQQRQRKTHRGDGVTVSFSDVFSFLREVGYFVREKSIRLGGQASVSQFFIDRTPVTLTRILVRANSIRLEMKQPIFIVCS
ncbi:MAG: hypothetical protein LBF84_03000 [Holosporales bacterium]|nr:hypothetical protein [Holosporales bacterium]